MKLLIGTDAHLYKSPDNRYYCDSVETYAFWKRYLEVFDSIRLVARVKEVEKVPSKYKRADGLGVEIWEIPFYQGPFQLAKQLIDIEKRLKGCYEGCNCALYRMPSQTAQLVLAKKPINMPYAGEVVYCPRDDVVGQPWGIKKIINIIISNQLKRFTKKANGVSYVTESIIQKYYPCRALSGDNHGQYFTSHYSSITLNDDYYLKPRHKGNDIYTISISDAAMNSERKGEKTVLKTIQLLRRSGYNVRGTIIGDGIKLKEFKEYANELGIFEHVDFTGLITNPLELRKILVESDFYMLPTRGEGLPRGILEAMALGLPVLSTNVGGISEVISEELLFAPDDAEGFAKGISKMIDDVQRREIIAEENYNKALEFRNDFLQKRRNDFYRKLALLAD